ncbi:unnamed protein product [Clavelina lepadiformis]|uniref:Uncharacterized protein n=1 Tax=Clavelina lepadiformis TaxID=159417 RepID=A0ABP0FIZ4_CLALP
MENVHALVDSPTNSGQEYAREGRTSALDTAQKDKRALWGNAREVFHATQLTQSGKLRCFSFNCDQNIRTGPPQWSPWIEVFQCQVTCGGGRTIKTRYCQRKGNGKVESADLDDCKDGQYLGSYYEVINCNTHPCPSNRATYRVYSTEPINKMFRRTPIKPSNNLCPASKTLRWVFGDFNGDKRKDVMCGEDSGTFHVGYADVSGHFGQPVWSGYMQDCSRGAKYSADFNGDGLDDLLCQDKDKRLLSIRLSHNGRFDADAVYQSYFCTGPSDEVILLDANADGKADILCNHGRSRLEILSTK